MVDFPFTNYAFTAAGAPATARTMPQRLGDVINVKDWGAKGNGVTDDTDAINAAIEYVYTNPVGFSTQPGATIFFPPGTYIISKGGTVPLFWDRNARDFRNPGFPITGRGTWIKYVGSGRDVTIIRGNYGTGEQMSSFNSGSLTRCGQWEGQVLGFHDMTIWNDSTVVASIALLVMHSGNEIQFHNCHFHGWAGMANQEAGFGSTWQDCIATCSVPITAADNATRAPRFGYDKFPEAFASGQFGTVGMYIGQGYAVNCRVEGFDIGIALTGGASVVGCHMSRCGIGLCTGLLHSSGIGVEKEGGWNVGYGGWFHCTAGILTSNWIDRCTWGAYGRSVGDMTITANRVSGNTGPCNPATISGITWSGGMATVTTTNAHNLPFGSSNLVLVTSPVGWTPDGSGNQIVSCLRADADTFTYPLAANLGSFSSATWNYPLEYGMTFANVDSVLIAANLLDAVVSVGSFSIYHTPSRGGGQSSAVAWCIRGASFVPAPGAGLWNAAWKFNQCALGTTPNPRAFAKLGTNIFDTDFGNSYTTKGPVVGDEWTAIDCATQNTFGGIVTAGSPNNHYKIRYNGTNWIRVG